MKVPGSTVAWILAWSDEQLSETCVWCAFSGGGMRCGKGVVCSDGRCVCACMVEVI